METNYRYSYVYTVFYAKRRQKTDLRHPNHTKKMFKRLPTRFLEDFEMPNFRKTTFSCIILRKIFLDHFFSQYAA